MSKPHELDGLLLNARLVTLRDDRGWGLIDDGVLGWRNGEITRVGRRDELPGAVLESAADVIDAGGRLVTPGLIDCHTHLVFAGDRAGEFEMRLNGESYEAIARAGGGILSTVR